MNLSNTIVDVPGIKVGHETNPDALTGCTIILCPDGATGGIDQRGGAPGTRESDLLRPLHLVEKVHAVLLAGGSAYGLQAADGVMAFLEEQGIGFDAGPAKVPIVPAAILFDLAIGDPTIRPDSAMGYRASQNASSKPPAEGNFGAGTGCSIGKILGMGQAMKAGMGTASIEIGNGVIVGAIVAVNAFGDVINPETGKIIAGARSPDGETHEMGSDSYFANTLTVMRSRIGQSTFEIDNPSNTIVGVVATNANLDKNETNKMAQIAHNGLARTIQPAQTMYDGDTIFALSTGEKSADVNIVSAFGAKVMAEAILRATKNAKSAGGLPGIMF